jgi:hypothetical protein
MISRAKSQSNVSAMINGLLILAGIIVAAYLITVLGFWKKDQDEPLLAWTKHTGTMPFLELFFLLVALVSALLLAILWLRG